MKKGEAEDFCIASYCHSQCCGLWDPGGRCRDTWEMSADSRGGCPEASDSVPILVSLLISSSILPLRGSWGCKKRQPAQQARARRDRINSKTLPWRAGKDNKDACYPDRTVKIAPVKPASLGVIGQCPAVPGLRLGRA